MYSVARFEMSFFLDAIDNVDFCFARAHDDGSRGTSPAAACWFRQDERRSVARVCRGHEKQPAAIEFLFAKPVEPLPDFELSRFFFLECHVCSLAKHLLVRRRGDVHSALAFAVVLVREEERVFGDPGVRQAIRHEIVVGCVVEGPIGACEGVVQQCEIVAPVKGDFRTAYALLGIYRVDPLVNCVRPAMIKFRTWRSAENVPSNRAPCRPIRSEGEIPDG